MRDQLAGKASVVVVLPVYGKQEFLSACLEALVEQTWTDFRVVCYLDCTDGESQSVLARFTENDERFQLCFADQQTAAEEINRELKNTKADYVMFLKPGDLCRVRFLSLG